MRRVAPGARRLASHHRVVQLLGFAFGLLGVLGIRGLGIRGVGIRGLGIRGIGIRGLGFRD